MQTKRCSACEKWKSLDEFHRNKNMRDGRNCWCKLCTQDYHRVYYRENKKRSLTKQREYREINIERLKIRDKKYYKENKERILARQRKWRREHPEEIKEANKRYRSNNKEAVKMREEKFHSDNPEAQWGYYLKNAYNLTVSDYNLILERQSGGCAICGRTSEKIGRRLHVDHNHDTGEIRGLLCPMCNQGLGMLQDSPELLRKAASYIEEDKEKFYG